MADLERIKEGLEKINNVELPCIYFNKHLQLVCINDAARKMYIGADETLIGKSFYEIIRIYDKDLNQISYPRKEILINVFNNPHLHLHIYELDWQGLRKLLQLEPIYNENIFEGVVGFIHEGDIGNKKKMNPSSDLKYRILFENVLEGIFILNDKARIIDYNPAAQKIYGKSTFEGLKVFDLFPHNTHEENEYLWNQFMQEGEFKGFYKYLSNPSNSPIYIEFKAKKNFLPGLHLAVFTDVTEKTLTQKSLAKSEANLKAIFNNSPDAIILIDLNYNILASNLTAKKKSERFLGFTLDTGYSLMSLANDKETLRKTFDRVVNGETIRTIYPIQEPNGKISYFHVTYTPIHDSRGVVNSICLSATDVTQRMEYETRILESEKKFRSLSESSPDVICIVDLKERKITYFNRTNILGYDSCELETSLFWRSIMHPDDLERVSQHWKKFLHANTTATAMIEYRVKNKSGVYEWIANRHIILERDDEDKPYKVLLNITVITENKKVEETLRNNEAKLSSLLENTSDLVWSIDSEFNITTANSAFKNLFKTNYDTEINVGDNLLTVLKSPVHDGWIALHKSALLGRRITAEFSWKSVNNENLYYEISYNPIVEKTSNMITGVSVFARDITQRKNFESAIMQTNFELDSFVYRASHDLRAPLRSILGLVNLLHMAQEKLETERYLTLIEKSIVKLDTFISDLINYSKNNRMPLNVEKISMDKLIDDICDNLAYMENANKVQVYKKIEYINGASDFNSDTQRLSILLSNMLSNSYKYMNPSAENSWVRFDVVISPDIVQIIVQDNGIGIKEEYLDKIFNMFFRASETSYGSGLGLYIVKQIVEKLEGRIEVSSEINKGTSFKITLPNMKSDEN
ncbi:MAG: PAS domain-containing sensor histidine kinase [Cytophagaceae bacterium]|nr:PAS domain-containing sensor histidine kinase [Cytophagaceae bacterium]MDW8455717.1 PAS domain-containing sensor histidine kinase [Cytophagaceae bacterium]